MKRHIVFLSIVLGIALTFCWGADSIAGAAQRRDYPAGFMPGMRVVLLADEPVVGPGLQAGMAGTIVCCDSADCTGQVLVSWDLWNGGQADDGRCAASAAALYPAGSATWVDPASVLLGQPFDEIGYLRQGAEGCLYLEAEDGGNFNLVGGAEFRGGWGVVLPGNYVRVRGLLNLNRVSPDAARICPQQDGDVYHPIMSLPEWTGTPCCDRWVCGFSYGDRVVLVSEDNPYGAADLPRGSVGTIICCKGKGDRPMLVSWDLWTDGNSDEAYFECMERVTGLYPPGSTLWVSEEDVAVQVQTDCGALKTIPCDADPLCPTPDWAGLFVRNDVYVLPDIVLDKTAPEGEFRAVGLYTPYATPPIAAGLSGTILQSVLLPCPKPNCCEPAYKAGDRVMLMVDEPGGAPGLLTGATGTVVCCDSRAPLAPILVSWDNWVGGHNDWEECDDQFPAWFPEDSGWWMMCSEMEALVLAELYDAGPAYQSFQPSVIKAGDSIMINGMIGNRGGANSGQFLVAVYASADREITGEDYLLGRAAMEIDAGGSASLILNTPLPADVPAGTYSIGWIIDPDDAVKEIIEKNNTVVIEKGELTVE